MRAALEDFEVRVKEVDAFFKILKCMERPQTAFLMTTFRGRRIIPIDPDGFTMMKATAFLVIYNLVEGAIRSSFDVFYNAIRCEELQLGELGTELREIWFKQQYHGIDSHSASPHTYQETARKFVEDILNHSVINLTERKLPLSGNLDANQIRGVYSRHGVKTTSHPKAYGGEGLRVVKQRRNALAHGSESFLECGREYTVEQLEGIKRETVIFVRSILRNMEKHIEGRTYAV